jgi:hypothetical protein
MDKFIFVKQQNNFSCGPTSLVIVLRSLGFTNVDVDFFKSRKNGYTRILLANELHRVFPDKFCVYNYNRMNSMEQFKKTILFFFDKQIIKNKFKFRLILQYKTIDEHRFGHFSPLINANDRGITLMDTSRKDKYVCEDEMNWQKAFDSTKHRGFMIIVQK